MTTSFVVQDLNAFLRAGPKTTVAYQVQVVDRVRPSSHSRQDRGRLTRRVGPGITGQADLLGDNVVQADRLGQPHHRHQPGTRNQIRIIKLRTNSAGTVL
jgi:hypothetical protein